MRAGNDDITNFSDPSKFQLCWSVALSHLLHLRLSATISLSVFRQPTGFNAFFQFIEKCRI